MANRNMVDPERFTRRLQEYEAEMARARGLEEEVARLTREFDEASAEAKPFQELKDGLATVERDCQKLGGEIDSLNRDLERGEEVGHALDDEIESWRAKNEEIQAEFEAGEANERQNGTLLRGLQAEKQRLEASLREHRVDLRELESVIEKGRASENKWTGLCRDARVLLARWKTTNQMLEAGGPLVTENSLASLVDEEDRAALKLLELMVANDNAFWETDGTEN